MDVEGAMHTSGEVFCLCVCKIGVDGFCDCCAWPFRGPLWLILGSGHLMQG